MYTKCLEKVLSILRMLDARYRVHLVRFKPWNALIMQLLHILSLESYTLSLEYGIERECVWIMEREDFTRPQKSRLLEKKHQNPRKSTKIPIFRFSLSRIWALATSRRESVIFSFTNPRTAPRSSWEGKGKSGPPGGSRFPMEVSGCPPWMLARLVWSKTNYA